MQYHFPPRLNSRLQTIYRSRKSLFIYGISLSATYKSRALSAPIFEWVNFGCENPMLFWRSKAEPVADSSSIDRFPAPKLNGAVAQATVKSTRKELVLVRLNFNPTFLRPSPGGVGCKIVKPSESAFKRADHGLAGGPGGAVPQAVSRDRRTIMSALPRHRPATAWPGHLPDNDGFPGPGRADMIVRP